MKNLVPAAMLAFLSACSTNLIGTQVPPYADGVTSKSGSCAGPSLEELCAFSINVLYSSENHPIGILAAKRIRMNKDSVIWKVTDQIPSPEVHEDQLLATYDCRLDGNRVWGLIAVVDSSHSEQGYSPALDWAYLLDHSAGKLKQMPAKGIQCLTST